MLRRRGEVRRTTALPALPKPVFDSRGRLLRDADLPVLIVVVGHAADVTVPRSRTDRKRLRP